MTRISVRDIGIDKRQVSKRSMKIGVRQRVPTVFRYCTNAPSCEMVSSSSSFNDIAKARLPNPFRSG